MTRNPLVNALAALLYIAAVASLMYYGGPTFFGREFMVIVPIAFISLFTLSAAVMGYIFLYQPLQLYLDGERSMAANLFLQTVAVFAGITALLIIITILWGSLL